MFPKGAKSYTGIADHAITRIKEKDGVISFTYKENVSTAIDEVVAGAEQVVGIYTLTGKSVPVDAELPHGVYIVRTNKGSHKIVR